MAYQNQRRLKFIGEYINRCYKLKDIEKSLISINDSIIFIFKYNSDIDKCVYGLYNKGNERRVVYGN